MGFFRASMVSAESLGRGLCVMEEVISMSWALDFVHGRFP